MAMTTLRRFDVPKGVMITLSRPASPDKRGAYNDWYSNQHAPEILNIPGVRSIRRFQPIDAETGELDPEAHYLAVIELEGANLPAIVKAMAAHVGPEKAIMHEVVELPGIVYLFEALFEATKVGDS
jgi:hypothetical protein